MDKRPRDLITEGIDLRVNGEVVTVIGKSTASASAPRGVELETDPKDEPSATESVAFCTPGSAIVQIDGFDFHITSQATDARITSELLAAKLGYERRSNLEDLAKRHAKFLNKFGGVRTVRIPLRAGARGVTTVDVPLYNRRQALYLVSKSEKDVANELTVRMVNAFDKLLDLAQPNQQTAAQPQDTSMALVSAMGTLMTSFIESQSRQTEAILKAIQGSVAPPREHESITPKKFHELEPTHQASIVKSAVASLAEQLAEEGVPNQYRAAWNAVYDQYKLETGDDVKKRASQCSDSTGMRTHPFDILKKEGKLVQLWEAARKMWTKKSN